MVVPEVTLNSGFQMPVLGFQMPVLGFGTAPCPFPGSEAVKQAILCGIRNGYRHFDTASLYQSEQALGEAIVEAVRLGLIKSRDELFITSKLWCCDCHPKRVLPALRNTLKNLQLDYLDLYLIHFPASSTPGKYQYPIPTEELFPMDFESVWAEMEKCQSLGLTKSIGVSNFSCKKIEDLLATAKIVPAVNQVEMNIIWHQGKLKEFCKMKNIIVTGYSPLGAMGTNWGNNRVMDCEVVNEIAKAKGKTHSQVCLRWIYEQGVTFVVKSFNEERMKQNMEIFDWELNKEENIQISLLPQSRCVPAEKFVSSQGPFKSLYEL